MGEHAAAEYVQLRIRDHKGTQECMKIKRTAPLRELMDAYLVPRRLEDERGPPFFDFNFDGERILRSDTADLLDMRDNDIIDAYECQTGMISTFESPKTANALDRYLMLSEEQRYATPPPLEQLRLLGDSGFRSFSYRPDADMLGNECRSLLCSFLEFMWNKIASDRIDIRVIVADDVFKKLLGADHGDKLLRDLKGEHWRIPGSRNSDSTKIILRMTRGPSNACIGFHRDGAYATGTVQVALNSDFEGGQLCFFVHDQLIILRRPPGSVCSHEPSTLHAVTALTRGSRKSLFVLDDTNGPSPKELDEPDKKKFYASEGIFAATNMHVQEFLDEQAERQEQRMRELQSISEAKAEKLLLQEENAQLQAEINRLRASERKRDAEQAALVKQVAVKKERLEEGNQRAALQENELRAQRAESSRLHAERDNLQQQAAQLANRIEELDAVCSVCFEGVGAWYRLDPCGHCFCEACATIAVDSAAKICHQCRQQVQTMQRLYFP